MLRCGKDGEQFSCFLMQIFQSRLGDNVCLNKELQPENAFVDLFHYDTDLGNKLGF